MEIHTLFRLAHNYIYALAPSRFSDVADSNNRLCGIAHSILMRVMDTCIVRTNVKQMPFLCVYCDGGGSGG